MRRPLLFILFTFFILDSFSQRTDFLLLKKRNKTIVRYYPGMHIDFTTNTGAYMHAYIDGLKNDSLFLKEYIVKTFMTQLGVYMLDTVAVYNHVYHYNQIMAIGKIKKGLDMNASAASLMGGGLLIAVASGVVYLADREKFSAPLLIASVSLAGLGYLIAHTGGKGMVIGKKYQLVYLGLSPEKNPKR